MNSPKQFLILSSHDASEGKDHKAASGSLPPGDVASSAAMQQSTSRLTSIAMEILLSIIQLLEAEDIENVRLTCQYLAEVAACILFREMVLLPSIDSARRIMKVAKKKSLAGHVQTLRYDGRWFSVIRDISKSMSVDQGVQVFLEELEELDERQFHHNNRGLESSFLSLIFYALPNLRHVLVQGPESSIKNLRLPRFYRRLMRDARTLLPNKDFGVSKGWGPQRSNGVLLALFSSQKPVKTLELINSNLHDIFCSDDIEDNTDGFLRPELDAVIGLRSLKIHLEKYTDYDDITGYTKSLGMTLQKMKRLESLSLKLVSRNLEYAESEELIELFSPVLEFQSDYLTHVSLSGVAVKRQNLVDFVLRHATSLVLFRTSEARLVTDSSDDEARLVMESSNDEARLVMESSNDEARLVMESSDDEARESSDDEARESSDDEARESSDDEARESSDEARESSDDEARLVMESSNDEARLVTDSSDKNAQLRWEDVIRSLKSALKEWNFRPLASGLVIESVRHKSLGHWRDLKFGPADSWV